MSINIGFFLERDDVAITGEIVPHNPSFPIIRIKRPDCELNLFVDEQSAAKLRAAIDTLYPVAPVTADGDVPIEVLDAVADMEAVRMGGVASQPTTDLAADVFKLGCDLNRAYAANLNQDAR